MSASPIGSVFSRVTGRRRPAPEPEPGFLDEIADLPEPPLPQPREQSGMPVAVAGPKPLLSPSWPCGRNGCVPDAEGRCWYGCEEEEAS